MHLSKLIDCGIKTELSDSNRDIEITGITCDSRVCEEGYLFAALPGSQVDGREFVGKAIANGAKAILSNDLSATEIDDNIIRIEHENPRLVLGHMAASFYGEQPDNIVAVTGTNGKSSVVHFCRQIWQSMSLNSASIGTLGISEGDDYIYKKGTLTSPDSISLHKTLREFKDKKINHVAIEASSHGLDQYRIAGTNLKVGAITNITRDHLDYHGTYEEYFKAKMKLFSEMLTPGSVAVINSDIKEYEDIAYLSKELNHEVISYGASAKDIKLVNVVPDNNGQLIEIEVDGKKYEIRTSLIGSFQASNLLCAIAMIIGTGAKAERVIEAAKNVTNAPGRMEKVANHSNGAPIMVDYAHTPDALEKVLQALRPHLKGDLWVVFGCGGDRDKGKRPLMGEVATKYADKIIITDDNPRGEDPAVIRKEILQSCPNAEEVGGREEAIISTINALQKDDLLVIAGKGHEKMQIIGDKEEFFDESEIINKAIGDW